MTDETHTVDETIAAIQGWRGERLSYLRGLIKAADPDVVETVKWRKPTNPAGVPVWEHDGILCTGGAFKGYVKITFAKGAKLPDSQGLFNGNSNGAAMRAIDLREGDSLDEAAFKALVRAAVALNGEARAKKGK